MTNLIDAHIVGVGMTPFGKHFDRTAEDLGREAVLAALNDAGIPTQAVKEAFCGSTYGGSLVGQRVLRDLGMTGMPITNIENACSSSAAALREASTAVSLGRADVVLVLGVDKLTALGSGPLPLGKTDLEAGQGMTMPALYAMRAQRYLHETGATVEHLAQVAVKARRHAAFNPYAQFRTSTTVADVLSSRMVADPLTLFMCCPTGDGASAAIVTSRAKSSTGTQRPVKIAASVLQSGLFKTGLRDMARSELTARTSRLAYDQAGLGPLDLDVIELHDAFASAEMMYYEALGLCPDGGAKDMVDAGETSIGGRIPVNTGGGLLCRGHPVGATGTAQICEAVWQLRGQAGQRQVEGARVALTHCTGGGVSGLDHGACAIHILTT
jgi:benzoylsuccinyl-CoA thiolase BbsB subunit